MPNINDLFPSAYLKAGDIEDGKDLVLTIKELSMETVGQGAQAEEKPCLYFEETEKGLILNKTNGGTIAGLYGPNTENWSGKKIALFATEVDFQGKQTLALRVRMKAPAIRSAQKVDASAPATDAAWDAWVVLAAEAEQLGISVPDLPDSLTTGQLRKAYGDLQTAIQNQTGMPPF